MKKWIKGLLLGTLGLTFLVGCSSNVSEDDLKENNWSIEPDEEDVPNMIASFSDHVMTLKVDVDSIESTATDEWEQMGEDFAKEIASEMDFKFEYTLDGDQITLKDTENEDESNDFEVSEEDDNIIFTPTDDSDEDVETITLQPYKNEKE
ncbi:peptidoglycan-binding protein LysM [Tetragenococcus halophilus]|uniref:Peptidoglycan-binding protein LysM n=1 Tax=Tetragenococcus halophilus TaxID=51669 RepID=A0AB35HMI6_TETHA|nr:peptidoglycan-binding protein LysM [Tetragenococcus halophilus]MCO8297455.1 peptidoglycan-binding protein LysM [Tetragenococcus halophilus]